MGKENRETNGGPSGTLVEVSSSLKKQDLFLINFTEAENALMAFHRSGAVPGNIPIAYALRIIKYFTQSSPAGTAYDCQVGIDCPPYCAKMGNGLFHASNIAFFLSHTSIENYHSRWLGDCSDWAGCCFLSSRLIVLQFETLLKLK